MSTVMAVLSTAAKGACKEENTVNENVLAAFKTVLNFRLSHNEHENMNSALAGALLFYGEGSKEHENISRSAKIVNGIASMQAGLPIDLTQLPKPEEAVPIISLWKEASGR